MSGREVWEEEAKRNMIGMIGLRPWLSLPSEPPKFHHGCNKLVVLNPGHSIIITATQQVTVVRAQSDFPSSPLTFLSHSLTSQSSAGGAAALRR